MVLAPISRRTRRAGATAAIAAVLAAATAYFLVGLTAGTAPAAATLQPILPATPSIAASPSVPASPSPVASPSPSPTVPAGPTSRPPGTTRPPTVAPTGAGSPPASGQGQWQYADGSMTFGWNGPVRSFKVAVEANVPVPVAEFTGWVDSTLADRRSWVGAGNVQLRRVPASSGSNFTIWLSSPWTAYSLCQQGGLDIRRNGFPYTSCRVGANVVINSDRYRYGADAFLGAGGSLADYRRMVINHEVGHFLGWGHMHCTDSPGAGLAHVMQQQTLRLEGCRPNPWPYPFNTPDPTPSPTPSTPPPTTEPSPEPSPPPPTTPEPPPTSQDPPPTEAPTP